MSRQRHVRLDHTAPSPKPSPTAGGLAFDSTVYPNTAEERRAVQRLCAEYANGDRDVLVELLDELDLR